MARVGDRRCEYRVLVWKSKGKSHLEDVTIDGRIILKGIIKKAVGKAWFGLIWPRIETSGGIL
jgi:hypothetical protein